MENIHHAQNGSWPTTLPILALSAGIGSLGPDAKLSRRFRRAAVGYKKIDGLRNLTIRQNSRKNFSGQRSCFYHLDRVNENRFSAVCTGIYRTATKQMVDLWQTEEIILI